MKHTNPISDRIGPAQLKGRLVQYDFAHRAWVIDGRYKCLHPPRVDCGCYGREHEGQKPRKKGAQILP